MECKFIKEVKKVWDGFGEYLVVWFSDCVV